MHTTAAKCVRHPHEKRKMDAIIPSKCFGSSSTPFLYPHILSTPERHLFPRDNYRERKWEMIKQIYVSTSQQSSRKCTKIYINRKKNQVTVLLVFVIARKIYNRSVF